MAIYNLELDLKYILSIRPCYSLLLVMVELKLTWPHKNFTKVYDLSLKQPTVYRTHYKELFHVQFLWQTASWRIQTLLSARPALFSSFSQLVLTYPPMIVGLRPYVLKNKRNIKAQFYVDLISNAITIIFHILYQAAIYYSSIYSLIAG